jgi:agmatinase
VADEQPPYNFGGLADEFTHGDQARIAVIPVPFDLTASWMRGTANGPRATIEASGYLELYDLETQTEVYLQGITTLPDVKAKSTTELNEKVYQAVKTQREQGKFVVALGGEHSIAFGSAKAHIEQFDDLSILHLDAHTDRRDEFHGDKFNHACTLKRISELNPDIISVGIRSLDASELAELDMSRVFLAEDIQASLDWIPQVVEKLKANVYLTFDLDVFDPSIMPSTGTPEPGGLGWYPALALLKAVSDARDLVGCDVVELMPNPANKAPDFLAAKLIYKILSYQFTN